MKKLFIFFGAIFALSSMAFSAPQESTIRSKTEMVYYTISLAANTSTTTVLIDLSSTTVWPHKETRELDLTGIEIQVDKVAASTCSIQLGVVNFVDSSTGSVSYFTSLDNSLNVSNTQIEDFVYTDNQMRNLRVNPASTPQSDGSTPYLLTNLKTSGSTIFQTDVLLPAPNPAGATFTGTGDLVMNVINGAGAIVVIVELTYHSEGD